MKNTVLHAEFGEAQRAACYLASGLSKAFPRSTVHVTFYTGTASAPRELTVAVDRLEPVLERMALRFPRHEMEVLYDPTKQGGVVGVLRCSCGHLHKMCCPLCCKTNSDKPQAVIRILSETPPESSAQAMSQVCSCEKPSAEVT